MEVSDRQLSFMNFKLGGAFGARGLNKRAVSIKEMLAAMGMDELYGKDTHVLGHWLELGSGSTPWGPILLGLRLGNSPLGMSWCQITAENMVFIPHCLLPRRTQTVFPRTVFTCS